MAIASYNEFLVRYRDLRQQYKTSCLWFEADEDTENPQLILNSLYHIEQHGDRDAFISARKLIKWLLPHFNSKSVSS